MNATLCVNQIRRISQTVFERLKVIPTKGLVWKANEDDPRKHTVKHEGLFYNLPEDKEIQQIFGAQSPSNDETTTYYKTIGTRALMIRQPFLKAVDYIKSTDNTTPNVRLLFYGDKGHGKTHTLVHLQHYLHLCQEHFIIHVREMKRLTLDPREHSESTSRPGRVDTPLDAAILLKQFRVQNANLLNKYSETLKCSKDYTWSLREVTKAGEPLVNVAIHGVNRVNHASDCVAVLFKELMLAADQGKIKLASILDDVGLLYKDEAPNKRHTDFRKVYVDEITVARAIRKLIKGSHKGGLVLATCDDIQSEKQRQTPRKVLGIEGWNEFDPCLPILVSKYSRKEFESCMNFYQGIGWLCRPEARTEEGRDEIRFMSGLNPLEVSYLCMAV